MSEIYSGAYENFGAACGAQLILYQMGSFALTGLPLEKWLQKMFIYRKGF